MVHSQHIEKAAFLLILVFIFFGAGVNAYAENSAWDKFVPPPDDKYDWIQLTSGEWLKGELKVLYDYEVEFDSDELDLLTFDLEDVKQIRTHKPYSISMVTPGTGDEQIIMEGVFTLVDNTLVMTVGDETREFEREQIISIAQSDKKEIELWSAKVTLGVNVKTGNTDTTDMNMHANAERHTVKSRMVLDYMGSYSEADSTETSNNHRLSGYRDYFISKKTFWRQLSAEYYRDIFKNIDTQLSLATLAGYHIIYESDTKWHIVAGLGGKYTKFDSTEPGESSDDATPTLGAGTMYDTELNKWMDFLVDYNFQIVSEEAGRYIHHFITTLSTDITSDLDLDISLVWDRIQDPQPNSDGSVPKKDDTQMIIGLSYDY